MSGSFEKPSDSVLDYTLDWTSRLDTGDTIASSTWDVPSASGVTRDSQSFNASANTTRVWVSGGTPGKSCEMTNTITTAASRTLIDRVTLYVVPPKTS